MCATIIYITHTHTHTHIYNVARVSGWRNYILEWRFDFKVNAKALAMTDGLSSYRVGPAVSVTLLAALYRLQPLKQ